MRKKSRKIRFVSVDKILRHELRDSEVRAAFEAERLRREAAQALARLRRKAHLTQAQLASKAGVPQSVIGRVESATGEGGLTLATVARVFSPLGRVHFAVRPLKSSARPSPR